LIYLLCFSILLSTMALSPVVVLAFLALVVFTGLTALLLVTVRRYRDEPQETPVIPHFSAQRYAPMKRLLSGDDLLFLSQTGCNSAVVKNWKKSQRRIFRLFLRDLTAEFQQLHRYARRLSAEAPETEHAQSIERLLGQQLAFWRTVVLLEARLTLSGLGLARVDASRLLDIMNEFQQQVSTLSPVGESAA
jgi:hypothetical protein